MIETFEDYVQKSKEDWWKCQCGSYHKGFPYKCPLKEFKRHVLNTVIIVLDDTITDECERDSAYTKINKKLELKK